LANDDGRAGLGEAYCRFQAAEAAGKDALAAEAGALLETLDLAAKAMPGSAEPLFDRGVVLEAVGRTQEARLAYRHALPRDDRHPGALLNLAASLASGDAADRNEAKELGRRLLAVELTPGERRRVQRFVAETPTTQPRAPASALSTSRTSAGSTRR